MSDLDKDKTICDAAWRASLIYSQKANTTKNINRDENQLLGISNVLISLYFEDFENKGMKIHF